VPLIPVSAAAAGKLKKRKNEHVTGADIAEEALVEQLVARKAASFFKDDGGEG
jgi:4'-phosphopantetheinyl transferase EntD